MSRAHIRACLAKVDDVDRVEGLVAYQRYHCTLHEIADHYGEPYFDRVVAAFVALSPQSDYRGNLRSLVSILAARQEGRTLETVTVSTYRHCAVRAWSYLAGTAQFATPDRGPKTLNFYCNIMDPSDEGPVTIDGHMHNVWRGAPRPLRESAVGSHYQVIADGFRAVAAEEGILPNQLQAMLWFCWKRIHRIGHRPQLDLFEVGDAWRTQVSATAIRPYISRAWVKGGA